MEVNSLTLEEKVGQLFIAAFSDETVNGNIVNLITTYKLGGVYYKHLSNQSPKQMNQLSTNLQLYANRKLPIFIGCQQAGGNNNTFSTGTTIAPDQQSLTRVNNRLYTKQMTEMIGNELYAMGMNVNFAPILTSEDSLNLKYVFQHGFAAIEGYEKSNVQVAATIDLLLNDLVQQNSLNKMAVEPYLQKLLQKLDIVVVSNNPFTSLQETVSASISSEVVTNLIRKKLDFHSVIIADHSNGKQNQIENVLAAIDAGVDIVVLNDSYENQLNVLNNVIEAVHKGIISEARVDESIERILAIKKKSCFGQIVPYHRENFMNKRAISLAEKLNELAQTVETV